jgi:hypothetical protein
MLRCVLCLREGQWPARLHDVEELESHVLKSSPIAVTKEAA